MVAVREGEERHSTGGGGGGGWGVQHAETLQVVADKLVKITSTKVKYLPGGRNSSVGSAWARCPQRRGFDPPLGTFSVEGIFPLELTWVQTPFPQKLLRMRV